MFLSTDRAKFLGQNNSEVTFALAEKPLTISHDHGRTWLATLGSGELGKVFKTGSCWGSKRAYICEHHEKESVRPPSGVSA